MEGRREEGGENSFTNCGLNLQEHGKAFFFTICEHTTQPQKVNAQTIFEVDGKNNWSGEKIRSHTGIIERARWNRTGSKKILEGDITNKY